MKQKTAIQDFIDEAIKYSRKLSTEGYLNESLAVDHIIDLAESLLEKEKEVMCEFTLSYFIDNTEGETIEDFFDETFNTKKR